MQQQNIKKPLSKGIKLTTQSLDRTLNSNAYNAFVKGVVIHSSKPVLKALGYSYSDKTLDKEVHETLSKVVEDGHEILQGEAEEFLKINSIGDYEAQRELAIREKLPNPKVVKKLIKKTNKLELTTTNDDCTICFEAKGKKYSTTQFDYVECNTPYVEEINRHWLGGKTLTKEDFTVEEQEMFFNEFTKIVDTIYETENKKSLYRREYHRKAPFNPNTNFAFVPKKGYLIIDVDIKNGQNGMESLYHFIKDSVDTERVMKEEVSYIDSHGVLNTIPKQYEVIKYIKAHEDELKNHPNYRYVKNSHGVTELEMIKTTFDDFKNEVGIVDVDGYLETLLTHTDEEKEQVRIVLEDMNRVHSGGTKLKYDDSWVKYYIEYTPYVETPSGGRHYYLNMKDLRVKVKQVSKKYNGLEFFTYNYSDETHGMGVTYPLSKGYKLVNFDAFYNDKAKWSLRSTFNAIQYFVELEDITLGSSPLMGVQRLFGDFTNMLSNLDLIETAETYSADDIKRAKDSSNNFHLKGGNLPKKGFFNKKTYKSKLKAVSNNGVSAFKKIEVASPNVDSKQLEDNPLAGFGSIKKEVKKEVKKMKDTSEITLEIPINKIGNYLKYIDSSEFTQWVKIGSILKREGYPFEIFDEWSKLSPNYSDTEDVAERWRTLKDRDGYSMDNVATIGSLIYEAKNSKMAILGEDVEKLAMLFNEYKDKDNLLLDDIQSFNKEIEKLEIILKEAPSVRLPQFTEVVTLWNKLVSDNYQPSITVVKKDQKGKLDRIEELNQLRATLMTNALTPRTKVIANIQYSTNYYLDDMYTPRFFIIDGKPFDNKLKQYVTNDFLRQTFTNELIVEIANKRTSYYHEEKITNVMDAFHIIIKTEFNPNSSELYYHDKKGALTLNTFSADILPKPNPANDPKKVRDYLLFNELHLKAVYGDTYEELVTWIGTALNPTTRNRTALLLVDEYGGVGKTIMMTSLQNMVTKEYSSIFDKDVMDTGRKLYLKDKMLTLYYDMPITNHRDDEKLTHAIKETVDSNDILTREYGKREVRTKNNINMIMATNHVDTLNGKDGQRKIMKILNKGGDKYAIADKYKHITHITNVDEYYSKLAEQASEDFPFLGELREWYINKAEEFRPDYKGFNVLTQKDNERIKEISEEDDDNNIRGIVNWVQEKLYPKELKAINDSERFINFKLIKTVIPLIMTKTLGGKGGRYLGTLVTSQGYDITRFRFKGMDTRRAIVVKGGRKIIRGLDNYDLERLGEFWSNSNYDKLLTKIKRAVTLAPPSFKEG